MAVYGGFVEQNLLLAPAGVPAGVGYEGFSADKRQRCRLELWSTFRGGQAL